MLLKKSSDYAIRLVFFLSQESKRKYTRLKHIAEQLNLPYYQLSKVAHEMVQRRILTSHTGPRGGVRLKRDPKELSLWDIIQPFEGDSLFDICVLGMVECDEENPCPIHEFWKDARDVLLDLFKTRSLDEIASSMLLKETAEES